MSLNFPELITHKFFDSYIFFRVINSEILYTKFSELLTRLFDKVKNFRVINLKNDIITLNSVFKSTF